MQWRRSWACRCFASSYICINCHTAEILLRPVSEKTAAILEFCFRLQYSFFIVVVSFYMGVPNFIRIGSSAVDLWRHTHFQDGGHQPCWICIMIKVNYPQSVIEGPSLILKFRGGFRGDDAAPSPSLKAPEETTKSIALQTTNHALHCVNNPISHHTLLLLP